MSWPDLRRRAGFPKTLAKARGRLVLFDTDLTLYRMGSSPVLDVPLDAPYDFGIINVSDKLLQTKNVHLTAPALGGNQAVVTVFADFRAGNSYQDLTTVWQSDFISIPGDTFDMTLNVPVDAAFRTLVSVEIENDNEWRFYPRFAAVQTIEKDAQTTYALTAGAGVPPAITTPLNEIKGLQADTAVTFTGPTSGTNYLKVTFDGFAFYCVTPRTSCKFAPLIQGLDRIPAGIDGRLAVSNYVDYASVEEFVTSQVMLGETKMLSTPQRNSRSVSTGVIEFKTGP